MRHEEKGFFLISTGFTYYSLRGSFIIQNYTWIILHFGTLYMTYHDMKSKMFFYTFNCTIHVLLVYSVNFIRKVHV